MQIADELVDQACKLAKFIGADDVHLLGEVGVTASDILDAA